MAARARHLLAEEDAAAAPDIASRGEHRLESPQLLDARPLRILKLLEERLRIAPHLVGVAGEQPLQSILAETRERRRRFAQHRYDGLPDRLVAEVPKHSSTVESVSGSASAGRAHAISSSWSRSDVDRAITRAVVCRKTASDFGARHHSRNAN